MIKEEQPKKIRNLRIFHKMHYAGDNTALNKSFQFPKFKTFCSSRVIFKCRFKCVREAFTLS